MPTGNLPAEGKRLWEEVHDKALKGSCKGNSDPEKCAAGSAWTAVKNAGWHKGADGQWRKKANLQEFSFTIVKAAFDKATQEMRWVATASDTVEDSFNDSMTPELFQSFLNRIENNEPAPESFKSDFWQGGMPYLSISHYPDLNGKAVPGDVRQVYIDGKYLKAKGTYKDNPLGRACFKAINNDLYNPERSTAQDKVRISIAFLDWKHKHKSNDFVFERKSLDDMCPECLIELIRGEYPGKLYLDGQLVHLAHTRVPVNKRTDITPDMEVDRAMTTRKDDAASIVGDELADELDGEAKVVGKSEAVVVKSEEVEKATSQIPGGTSTHTFVPDGRNGDGDETKEGEKEDCVDKKTGKVDEDCMKREMAKKNKAQLIEDAMTKSESWGDEGPGSYLIVGDPEHPTTWHLPYKKHGKIDRGLAGAAKAALTSNHRGKSYGGPDKEKAISKLKRIYSENGWDWNAKSEAEIDAEFEDSVLAQLAEVKSLLAPKPTHVLDPIFTQFKADFDDVLSMNDIDPEGRLRLIQESFNKVGNAVADNIRNVEQPEQVAQNVDVVKELSQLMKPVLERMDLIDAKLDKVQAIQTTLPHESIPQRRNIAPTLPMQQQAQVATPTKQSETPNLRKLIERTT